MGEGRHNVVLNIVGTNASAYDSSVPLDWARPPFVGIPSSNEINRIDVEVPYNGCPVSGGGYNCTRACLNSSYAFSDIATLRSCVLYPSLINSYLHNLEVNDEEGLLNNHGLSVNSSELASGVSRVITNHLNGVLKEGNECKNWYLSGDSDVSRSGFMALEKGPQLIVKSDIVIGFLSVCSSALRRIYFSGKY